MLQVKAYRKHDLNCRHFFFLLLIKQNQNCAITSHWIETSHCLSLPLLLVSRGALCMLLPIVCYTLVYAAVSFTEPNRNLYTILTWWEYWRPYWSYFVCIFCLLVTPREPCVSLQDTTIACIFTKHIRSLILQKHCLRTVCLIGTNALLILRL